MAESAVNFLLNQIRILIGEERQLLGGLDLRVQCIKDDLELMQAFLRVADAKEDGDHELQAWVRQVRELAYDAQDVLDLFMLRFAHDGARASCRFLGPVKKPYAALKNCRARRRVAVELGNIQTRLKAIHERRQVFQSRYGDAPLQQSSSSPYVVNVNDRRGDALLVDEAMLVGIEVPKKELIDQLFAGNTQLKTISVVGMGGLGKTTLVKRTYEEERVKGQFQCHAWVTVSQSFDINDLLKNLIRQLYGERKEEVPRNIEFLHGYELKESVKDFLCEKTYVIVFDDVWNTDSWDALRHALPNSNNGSCILLTTRILDVAFATKVEYSGYIYEMKGLSMEDSWTLFCNKTFRDKICPPRLKEISKRILTKCEGLPLAILAIGGLLSTKDSISEWERINSSLGSELDGDHGKLVRVKEVIMLSYYDLPYYLKTCLLYFSILPEDLRIRSDKIIRLWNSEGFLQGRENMTREEVGFVYLGQLVQRSLVQVDDYTGECWKECRVHDIVREVIVAKSREQNLVSVESERDSRSSDKVRRLAIHDSIDNINNGLDMSSLKQIRSLLLLVTRNSKVSISEQFINTMVASGNRLLKVFSLRFASLKEIPNEVFKLYLLTYLDLRGTQLKVLPKAIGKLVNLETLDLADTNVVELPIQILKLQRLRHLFVYKVIREDPLTGSYDYQPFKAPYQIGCLSSLQSLSHIDADHVMGDISIVREIGRLTQLRGLGISNLRRKDGKDLFSSLDKLGHLQFLFVTSTQVDEIIDLNYAFSSLPRFLDLLSLRGRLKKMPQWIPQLCELTTVQLYHSKLSDDPLEFLEELPKLKSIFLLDAFQGTELHFRARRFRSLKSLCISSLRGLKSMIVHEYSMPRLDALFVYFCDSMVDLPIGLEHLTKLQKFQIYGMNDKFVEAIESAKATEKKLAHISVQVFDGNNLKKF